MSISSVQWISLSLSCTDVVVHQPMMKRACPSILLFFGRSPVGVRARAHGGEYISPVLALLGGQKLACTSSKEMRSVGYYNAHTSGSLQCTLATSYVVNPTVPLSLGTKVVWVTSPAAKGCTVTSVKYALCHSRLVSTGIVVQKPLNAISGDDRQQHGRPGSVTHTSTAEGHDVASRHTYTDVRSFEGNATSPVAPAQQQTIDNRVQSAQYSAVHPGWSTGTHSHSPSRESFHGGQPPHSHGYPPSTSHYDMQTTHHLSSPYSTHDYPEVTSSPVSPYQYPGTPSESFAPTYNTHWDGFSNPGVYTNNSAPPVSSPEYVGSEGAAEQLASSRLHGFGGAPQPYNSMPVPQHEFHPHMYPVGPGHQGTATNITLPVNLPPSQMLSPSAGVPLRSAVSPDPVPTRSNGETHFSRNSFDSTGVGGNASETFLGTRLRGHLNGGGTGEERLEQLLVEIRQRLGNRANAYDAALEQDPRALLQLACRPESLRRMQHSSLDWWYVLFRWQDRYHAMQLSGEIRRRNAAAAAAAVSSSNAAATDSLSGSRGSSSEKMRGLGHEKSGLYSFFSPEDEEAFFVFLQKLQQAFAARPLSEEAQTHGRLHDRMRCIRQLARAVSDDHRALGMGAAAKKEADSLLWSLALQEARCAANGIDILRTKGGMPMLLSILRLAETADRRRRRSATRVLVSLNSASQDVSRKSTSETEIPKRQDDVIIQNFAGGRQLKWEWISADETQQVFDKLADAFLSCAQEANIEPCVHAVVGMGTLAEKSFLNEGKWQKVCQAMTDRLKLSEMVSAGAEAGLLLDSLTWMFVRNANASRRCRHVIFQVNFLLGQILRDTRSDVVARCVLGLALCRVFREENLLFYTSVLLKRQLRSDEPRKTLTPRAFCNLLVANAIAGVSAKQHLGVVVKYLLNTMVTHDRAKNLSLEETARLAWAICALQLYDPAVAGSQWPAKEAAELLGRLLSRIGRLVDGPHAAYILEALRDSHDCVAPLYPDMGFTDNYADQVIRQKACSAYDQSHLGLGGTIITVVRGALRSFGGAVTPGPERRSLLTRLRNVTGALEESDTASNAEDKPFQENYDFGETTTPQTGESVSVEVSKTPSTAGEVAFCTEKPAKRENCSGATTGKRESSEDSKEEEGNTVQSAKEEVQDDSVVERGVQTAQAKAANAPSESESTAASLNVPISTDSLRKAEWIEGAVLDGYPVSFYSPNLKVALDVDVCSKLPSKYMKRRHMDNHLRRNGIRHVVFCADLKRPQEPLYSLLERVLKDDTGTLGSVGFHPTRVRAYLRTDRNSQSMRTNETD